MIGLVRSEILRARSRRIVWVLLIASILGVVVGVVIAMANSDRPTEQELDRARGRQERTLDECRAGTFTDPPGEVPEGYGSIDEYCEDVVGLELQTDAIGFDALPAILEGASSMLVLLGIVLGASLAGADWSTGTMTTLLAWEPRRVRVWVVRAAVAILVVALVTVVVQLVFAGAWFVATTVSGTTETPSGFIGDALSTGWKVAAIVAVFAFVAHAFASIGRSTIAGVGVVVGYAVIFEVFIANLSVGTLRWMLIRASTVILSGTPLTDPRASVTIGPDGRLIDAAPDAVLLDVGDAWTLFAIYVVVFGGLAVLAFRARDVQ